MDPNIFAESLEAASANLIGKLKFLADLPRTHV